MNSPVTSTLQVWHALFLRETLDRLFGVRIAWLWLIIEPAIHIAFISFVMGVIRKREVGGANAVVWIIVGMLAFFLFRRTAVQTLHALDCNKAFFVYRQVRPFDAAFIRAFSEAFIMTLISLFMLAATAFFGLDVFPGDPLYVMLALAGVWLFALSYGLVGSVLMRLAPESGHILQIFMMPLYLISGVIMPIATVPQPYRDWLLWNPVLHGIELVRVGFFPYYHGAPEASLGYLFWCAFIGLALGLALYRAFEMRLVMQ